MCVPELQSTCSLHHDNLRRHSVGVLVLDVPKSVFSFRVLSSKKHPRYFSCTSANITFISISKDIENVVKLFIIDYIFP